MLIREWRRNRPKKQRPPKVIPMVIPEVNMNACDACGLSRDVDNYGAHNCFDVIKQTGRSDLAGEILTKIAGMSDASGLDYVKQVLREESKAMPKIEAQEIAKTA
jgi:hypothetical protein